MMVSFVRREEDHLVVLVMSCGIGSRIEEVGGLKGVSRFGGC